MRFTLSLAALAAIAAPVSANTIAPNETVTVRIAYADLDLSTAEGRAMLEQRIAGEIEEACTVAPESRYAFGRDVIDETCVTEARAQATAIAERAASADGQRSGRAVAAN